MGTARNVILSEEHEVFGELGTNFTLPAELRGTYRGSKDAEGMVDVEWEYEYTFRKDQTDEINDFMLHHPVSFEHQKLSNGRPFTLTRGAHSCEMDSAEDDEAGGGCGAVGNFSRLMFGFIGCAGGRSRDDGEMMTRRFRFRARVPKSKTKGAESGIEVIRTVILICLGAGIAFLPAHFWRLGWAGLILVELLCWAENWLNAELYVFLWRQDLSLWNRLKPPSFGELLLGPARKGEKDFGKLVVSATRMVLWGGLCYVYLVVIPEFGFDMSGVLSYAGEPDKFFVGILSTVSLAAMVWFNKYMSGGKMDEMLSNIGTACAMLTALFLIIGPMLNANPDAESPVAFGQWDEIRNQFAEPAKVFIEETGTVWLSTWLVNHTQFFMIALATATFKAGFGTNPMLAELAGGMMRPKDVACASHKGTLLVVVLNLCAAISPGVFFGMKSNNGLFAFQGFWRMGLGVCCAVNMCCTSNTLMAWLTQDVKNVFETVLDMQCVANSMLFGLISVVLLVMVTITHMVGVSADGIFSLVVTVAIPLASQIPVLLAAVRRNLPSTAGQDNSDGPRKPSNTWKRRIPLALGSLVWLAYVLLNISSTAAVNYYSLTEPNLVNFIKGASATAGGVTYNANFPPKFQGDQTVEVLLAGVRRRLDETSAEFPINSKTGNEGLLTAAKKEAADLTWLVSFFNTKEGGKWQKNSDFDLVDGKNMTNNVILPAWKGSRTECGSNDRMVPLLTLLDPDGKLLDNKNMRAVLGLVKVPNIGADKDKMLKDLEWSCPEYGAVVERKLKDFRELQAQKADNVVAEEEKKLAAEDTLLTSASGAGTGCSLGALAAVLIAAAAARRFSRHGPHQAAETLESTIELLASVA